MGLIARVFPGCRAKSTLGEVLGEAGYLSDGLTYAASFQGDLVYDRRLMLDLPSELPGRRLILHAMRRVLDWFASVVREAGRRPSTPWTWATKPREPSSASSWKAGRARRGRPGCGATVQFPPDRQQQSAERMDGRDNGHSLEIS
ncbi:DUF6928 family protein [Streptomyces wedmorensis]